MFKEFKNFGIHDFYKSETIKLMKRSEKCIERCESYYNNNSSLVFLKNHMSLKFPLRIYVAFYQIHQTMLVDLHR